MSSLSIKSTAPLQNLSAPTQAKKPAEAPATPAQKTEIAADSLTLGSTPSLGDSVKEGVKFQAGFGAKTGALVGGVTGGLTVPILAIALTGGGALGNNSLLLKSAAVGVLGGAAVGAGAGALSGSVSGAINGAIVSVADSKAEAQLYTGLAASGVSILSSVMDGKTSLAKGALNAVISGGVAAYVGGRIYDNATK